MSSTNPGSGASRAPDDDATTSRDSRPSLQPAPSTSAPSTSAPVAADAGDRPGSHQGDGRTTSERQRERFGGVKWGAAFFGWLTAIGTLVLLTALVSAVGGAIGLAGAGSVDQATDEVGQAVQNPGAAQIAGVVGAIVVAVILLIAYFCGGYVAGRMARFSGARQGIAVWVWTIVITVVVAVVGAVAGDRLNLLGGLAGVRLPADPGALGVAGIVSLVIALVVSLVGAVLGGLAGMRYHRRIDRADLAS